jgi:hypothetical protein
MYCCCFLGSSWFVLAARSRTYFWRERADAAVDYGLGRTDVRGICCFGHIGGLCVVVMLVWESGGTYLNINRSEVVRSG